MSKLSINISGAGSPLILIHGWGWNSTIWDSLLPQLEKKYQVFAVDLPGFGKSSLLTNDYTFAEIVPILLEHLPQEATWLGWSLGGLFALWTAIHFPERVTKLITVASSPKFVAEENWPGIPTSTLEKFSARLLSDPKQSLLDFLELQLRGSPHRELLFAELSQKLFSEDRDLLPGLMGGLALLRDTDLRREMKKIKCPSLHILGQRDTIVPVSIAELAFSGLPESHYEIMKNTGHMPFLTHGDIFLLLVSNF